MIMTTLQAYAAFGFFVVPTLLIVASLLIKGAEETGASSQAH